MYTMEKEVLAEFQLKITKIGDDIAKTNSASDWGHIRALVCPNCAQNIQIWRNIIILCCVPWNTSTEFQLKITMIG